MEQINRLLASLLGPSVDEKHLAITTSLLVASLIILAKAAKEITRYMVKLMGVIVGVFKPLDYELDMTTNEFCKYLAEVDNNLRIQTERERVTQIKSDEQSGVNFQFNCATSALGTNVQAKVANVPNNTDNSSSASKTDSSDENGNQIYPNGWLSLMESSKVKANEIKRALFMGCDLIITRSGEGKVEVLSAYCPHMGVNIGVGGRVRQVNNESCVQCPFHGWTFRASDGQCVSIPYANSTSKCGIPKQAQLKTYYSCEVDEFIYVWHHNDDQPPNWHLKPTPELASGKFVLAGRSCHKTNLEMRDMLENGADVNHFDGIHNDLFVLGSKCATVQAYNFVQKYSRHHYEPEWKPILTEEGKPTHMAEMNLDSWISLFKLRLFDIEVRAIQFGPSCVRLRYNSAWYGKGVLNMNAVPLGGRRTLYVQHIYAEPSLFNWIMAKLVLIGEITQLERDLFIWNHKKNISSPVFVPEDKIIKRFRLWYSQFYKRKCKITIGDSAKPKMLNAVVNGNVSLEF